MYCPKRFLPVLMGFSGFLIIMGCDSTVSMVMVHISKSEDEIPDFLGFHCFENASQDVTDTWTLSSIQYLNCAFFSGIFTTQLLGGYLASRFSAKMVAGIVVLIGSNLLIMLPTAIKVHFVLVFVIRTLQGFLFGCGTTAIVGVVTAWTPKSEKNRMTAVMFAGEYLSPAVAFAVSGITACVVSWTSSLYIYGGCGVAWSVIWLIYVFDTPPQHSELSQNERLLFEMEGSGIQQGSGDIAKKIPWRRIVSSPPMWAILVCSFCFNWAYSLLTSGLPQYFKVAFTTNIAQIGLKAALSAVCTTIMALTSGVLFDALIKYHLVSTTVGRKIAQCVGFGVEGCCLLCLGYTERLDTTLIVLYFGFTFNGLCACGYQVNSQDLAPQYTSVLTSFYRLGILGGVSCTALSGILVPKNIKVWQNIFTISGSVLIAGAIFYGIFASSERQNWNDDTERKLLLSQVTQDKEDRSVSINKLNK